MKKVIPIVAMGIVVVLAFSGCGGGGGAESSSDTTTVATVTGQFIDAPVKGLKYVCSSGANSMTNNNGEYTCNIGSDVTFYIGTLSIGTVAAQVEPITPYSLFPNNNVAAVNLARILQTLNDRSIVGVINIDAAMETLLPSVIDLTSVSFETTTKTEIENAIGTPLISAIEAKESMDTSILTAGGTVPSASNSAPVANAGVDQNVNTTSTVTLNGSLSSDANLNALTYVWSIISKPTGSNATLSSATAVNPTLVADLDGSYVVQLVVNDGIVNSVADTVTVIASTSNSAPVANAGVDQNVNTTSTVTLNGSLSSDANLDALTYSWTITSKPSGSNAALSSATVSNPTLIADLDGSYVIQLVVNDGKVNSAADTVTVIASTSNSAPVANAGVDQNVNTTSTVTLNGSLSSDANLDALTYSWTITSKPSGSNAALSSATVSNPTLIADLDGSYVIQLVVNDGKVNSAADTVTVIASTSNSAPVANAGVDQNVDTGITVTLNGSGTDADFDTLTYFWSFVSKPFGSTATFSEASSTSPTFTADKYGSYVIELVVNDGKVNSTADTIVVNADNLVTHVSTTAEFRIALTNAAQNGMNDKIILADGTYKTTDDGGGTFTFLDNEDYRLTIIGSSRENVILSGEYQQQILNVTPNNYLNELYIKNITFQNGRATSSSKGGGAIHAWMTLHIDNCSFHHNQSILSNGGATIAVTTKVSNSLFFNNSASNGGAINTAKIEIDNTTFLDNIAGGDGGAVYAAVGGDSQYSPSITDTVFENNSALSMGGGLYLSSDSQQKLTMKNTKFIRNKLTGANGLGTGIYSVSDLSFDIEGCIFKEHANDFALFLMCYDCTIRSLTITNSLFTQNTGRSTLATSFDDAKIINSMFADNNNTEGTINASNLDNMTIVNSAFTHNHEFVEILTSATYNLNVINSYLDLNKVTSTNIVSISNLDVNINFGFIDQPNDYHLITTSDLIDTGTNSFTGITIPTTDLDGNSRKVGITVDIGPYEFQ
ncbi:MAG: hypothetical protein IBX43_05720 [Campylobacterales bacterium]|nr:hypothetical protein [Campylobacterales bacterium]